MTFPIICFDGGGIRGLVSALMFEYLQEKGDLTQTPAMYAGTSTGSFLAIGMASGMKVEQFVDIYMHKGGDIFVPLGVPPQCNPLLAEGEKLGVLSGIWEDIESIFAAKYGSEGLRKTLHPHFGDKTMQDLAQGGARVVVNSLKLWSPPGTGSDFGPQPVQSGMWKPVAIGTGPNDPHGSMRLIDAAMASGAAPTYFPPHQPKNDQGWGYFADGGLFANNPAAAAIAYAVSEYDVPLEEISVLSFGTGGTMMGIPKDDIGHAACWGGWKWLDPNASKDGLVPAVPLLEASLCASAEACGEVARHLVKDRYIRADIALNSAYPLDDWQNVQKLRHYVHTYMDKDPRWAKIREKVKASWG